MLSHIYAQFSLFLLAGGTRNARLMLISRRELSLLMKIKTRSWLLSGSFALLTGHGIRGSKERFLGLDLSAYSEDFDTDCDVTLRPHSLQVHMIVRDSSCAACKIIITQHKDCYLNVLYYVAIVILVILKYCQKMAASLLKPPDELNICASSKAAEWECFKQRFDVFAMTTNLTSQGDEAQAATLVYFIGSAVNKVSQKFTFNDEGDRKTLGKLKEKFEAYCVPKKNATMERHTLLTRHQHANKPFDEIITDLRTKAR